MSKNNLNHDHISSLLQQCIVQLNELLEILHLEYEALSNSDHEKFQAILQDKQNCSSKLIEIELEIFHNMSTHGFSGDHVGLKEYISSIKLTHNHTIQQWESLQTVFSQCNEQNQVNSRIINITASNIAQSIKIMTGQENNESLYDTNGKTKEGSHNSSFGVA